MWIYIQQMSMGFRMYHPEFDCRRLEYAIPKFVSLTERIFLVIWEISDEKLPFGKRNLLHKGNLHL
jgi:hypothetical protein